MTNTLALWEKSENGTMPCFVDEGEKHYPFENIIQLWRPDQIMIDRSTFFGVKWEFFCPLSNKFLRKEKLFANPKSAALFYDKIRRVKELQKREIELMGLDEFRAHLKLKYLNFLQRINYDQK